MGYESPNVNLIDINGNSLPIQNGAAIPASTPSIIISGSDGTNSRYITVDSSGRQLVVGAGTAGTPVGGVISIQGVSGGQTVPISGTVTATNPSVSTTGSAPPASATLSGGSVTTAAPTYTTGQMSALSLTTTGLLRVDGSGVIQPVSDAGGSLTVDGTVTANQGTANTLANRWPTIITDGTNTMPTGDAVGRAIFNRITDGTNAAAVKAASTAAITTDAALVVAVSPNNTVATQVADVTNSGALNALNASVQLTIAGHTTAGFQLVAGSLIGTIVAETSFDGGTTWNSTYIDIGNKVSSIVFSSSNTATAGTIVGVGGSGLVRIKVSAFTSGTASITLRGSIVNDPTIISTGLINATSQPPTTMQISGWDGSTLRVPAVKAPSTAAIATDQALVVVLSPNQQAIPVTTSPSTSTPNLSNGDIILSASGTTSSIRRTAYTEQTVNFIGSIASASANDTAAGTGARTVKIYYVDSTGATVGTETATLNGTTGVNLVTTTKCFIEKIEILTAGSTGSNVGIISLYTGANKTGTVVGTIAATDNTTYWAHHYVVTGKICNVTGVYHGNNSTVAGGVSVATLKAQTLNIANAVEKQISDFIGVAGAANPFTRIYGSVVQITGPARLTMYVTTGSSSSITYRGSFDSYDS